jgi:hypothetical protein
LVKIAQNGNYSIVSSSYIIRWQQQKTALDLKLEFAIGFRQQIRKHLSAYIQTYVCTSQKGVALKYTLKKKLLFRHSRSPNSVSIRVTRPVCEKIAQSVAQAVFFQNLSLDKNWPKILRYVRYLKKTFPNKAIAR